MRLYYAQERGVCVRKDPIEPKKIYCPRCGRKVMTYDGKGEIDLEKKCKICNKLVVYQIARDQTILADIPQREHGSGVRFW